MNPLLPSVAAAIGQTPLVELSRLAAGVSGRILAKLEFLNPGFSKKDRVARQMVADAKADGRLQPGQPVIELTSGNTGTGLAIVCATEGHPFVAVMSRGNSMERARMMTALGAEVVLVEQYPGSSPGQVSGPDLQLVEERTQELAEERGAFRADQFLLESNFRAHFLGTGPEILQQVGGPIDGFCDFVGSGGSFAGCSAAFKAQRPETLCFVVEPTTARALGGGSMDDLNHRIQGGGYARSELPLLDPATVDGYLAVSDQRAMEVTRRLAREEGIFAGFSSGANVAAALELLDGRMAGATLVTLICDSGLKYLSTDLWPG